MRVAADSRIALISEANAGIAWVSGTLRWTHIVIPCLMAVLGVACVGIANAAARQGSLDTRPLWWVGVLVIFAPAAATLLLAKVSRAEALSVLLVVGIALYVVRLLYAPGMLWGYDELLHYRTVDNILTTRHLFSTNSLLPVSPYYPGMEMITAVIVQLTGLSIVQSGFVLIVVARLLTVTSLFLLFERIATPSRFAALATLLYMACPSFLHFDSMFAYESLALALALACLFVLRASQLEGGEQRYRLNAVGALLLLAVVVTHHVTSFILIATLVAWTLAELTHVFHTARQQGGAAQTETRTHRWRTYLSALPGSGWVPLLGVVAVLVWLTNVAEVTMSYLWPQLMSGFAEVWRIIRLEGTGRRLFESTAGHSAPLLERVVGIGSVLIILVLIPLGISYLWERRRFSVLARFFAICSLAYPATLALRFTRSGWQVGARATAFVYVPLAFTIAAGIVLLTTRQTKHARLYSFALVFIASILFTGGIIAGTSPTSRQPAPYDPGVSGVPYETESLAAADWAAATLGPGYRFAADSAGGALIGSIGRQRLVTSEDGVSISALFLSPGFNARERAIVKDGDIDYVLVDRRIAGTEPLKGFIYERWERMEWDYGSSVSSETVNKFGLLRDTSKVFDSGSVQIFGLHRLTP